MRQAIELAAAIAPTRTPVLIVGERGTGKTLLARAIHRGSPRRDGPFVEVACDGHRDQALERELFGHAGEFGGPPRPGKVAQADGGTIVLDEVAALSPDLQFKLLRFLQDGAYEPVGSTQTARADVRIVVATAEDLAPLVEQGRFRQDLYYRIGVVRLKLPPLRQRVADIPVLAEHFRVRFARGLNKDVAGFMPEAMDLLKAHRWPGNVRELENAVERGVVLCRGPRIAPIHLALSAEPPRPPRPRGHTPHPHVALGIRPLKEALEGPEKQIIVQALEALNWNRQETARVLDINRTTLYKKMKKYGLLAVDEPAWLG
jgi:two-component system response regulator HydG